MQSAPAVLRCYWWPELELVREDLSNRPCELTAPSEQSGPTSISKHASFGHVYTSVDAMRAAALAMVAVAMVVVYVAMVRHYMLPWYVTDSSRKASPDSCDSRHA
jgi:hypothetical protein